jgi:hypothetical protein
MCITAGNRSPVTWAAAVLAVLSVVTGPAGEARPGQRNAGDSALQALAGTIDIHVHSDPDNVPRINDGLEAAKLARSKGMRGIVLKNHYDPTAGLAFLARKEAPGLEVFGSIDLNLTVGGMNAVAVEHMTQVAGGGDASSGYQRSMPKIRVLLRIDRSSAWRTGAAARDKAVISVIAKHGLAATGHVSAQGGLLFHAEDASRA